MKRLTAALILTAAIAWSAPTLIGFCGFYVAKADTRLFNRAHQTVQSRLAGRDGP
jgi:hypothetical protein